MTVVRLVALPAERIVNLASPRYVPELFRAWRGKRDWHDPRYEPLRDVIEDVYVKGFDLASGHYQHLEASMLAEGFRNPVVLSAGGLDRRDPDEIPPQSRGPDTVACEYLGGSRVWVAQRLGLIVPAVVNDHANVFPDAQVLRNRGDILSCFTDPPATLSMDERGVYLNDLPYTHLPEALRYTMQGQAAVRRQVLKTVHRRVRLWLREYDR